MACLRVSLPNIRKSRLIRSESMSEIHFAPLAVAIYREKCPLPAAIGGGFLSIDFRLVVFTLQDSDDFLVCPM